MTTLHLVRHGPTHAKTMVGWSDLPADLSDTAALQRLHDHLPDDALVVSSDLIRASATADAIQGSRSRLPHRENLREINFGTWEQRSFKDIEAEDPQRAFSYWTNPGNVHPPEGESWNETCARVNRDIDRLIEQNTGNDLIVVVHFGVILTQIQRALGIDAKETFSYKIDNLSLTQITRHPQGWDVRMLNHTL